MTKIRCVVERITYQNPDNGYSVLKVRLNGYDDLITVVGNLLDVTAGSVLSIEGDGKSMPNMDGSSLQSSGRKQCPPLCMGLKNTLAAG